eukprot:2861681-Rhodomonas_salina.1
MQPEGCWAACWHPSLGGAALFHNAQAVRAYARDRFRFKGESIEYHPDSEHGPKPEPDSLASDPESSK